MEVLSTSMTMTTMNKNIIVDNFNLSVSPGIKFMLPDVLIEYLWKLALGDSWQTYESQLFILEPGELSGRKIQDIYHICNCNNSIDTRRVYGVEPVNCKLQVSNSKGNYQMQLCLNI